LLRIATGAYFPILRFSPHRRAARLSSALGQTGDDDAQWRRDSGVEKFAELQVVYAPNMKATLFSERRIPEGDGARMLAAHFAVEVFATIARLPVGRLSGVSLLHPNSRMTIP
jgi:hypothetical protein